MDDLRSSPLKVDFSITGTPEQLIQVKHILAKHGMLAEMQDE